MRINKRTLLKLYICDDLSNGPNLQTIVNNMRRLNVNVVIIQKKFNIANSGFLHFSMIDYLSSLSCFPQPQLGSLARRNIFTVLSSSACSCFFHQQFWPVSRTRGQLFHQDFIITGSTVLVEFLALQLIVLLARYVCTVQ